MACKLDGSNPTTGNIVGQVRLPNIDPGQSKIIEMPWTLINPYDNNTWNSCLLSRIENTVIDPITAYPNRLDEEINFNNNLSLRNLL